MFSSPAIAGCTSISISHDLCRKIVVGREIIVFLKMFILIFPQISSFIFAFQVIQILLINIYYLR